MSTGPIPYPEQDGSTSATIPLYYFLMTMLGITEDEDGQLVQASSLAKSKSQANSSLPGCNGTGVPPYLFDSALLDEVDFGGVGDIPMLDEAAILINKQFMIGPVYIFTSLVTVI